MAQLIISERAKKDLTDIWDYTVEEWSKEQAVKYYNDLLDAFEEITKHPNLIGRAYDNVRPGLYGVLSGRHVIFFRILSKEKVRIVRILHCRMDYPRHLN